MRKLEPVQLKPWSLPLIVIAVVVPIVAAFMFGGPGAGLAVGALAAAAILVLAARASYDEEIEVGSSPGDRYMLLVVITRSLEDPGTAGAIAEIARAGSSATGADSERAPEVLVLTPAFAKPVAQWLSDVGPARFDAQRRLALSLGTLAAAHVEARGQVGDADTVQAVEDALRTFPAQEVVFVAGPEHAAQIEDVRRRLDRPVRQLPGSSPAQTPSRS